MIDDKEKFYVYLHFRSTDDTVFYVGKGKGSRFKSKSGRSDHWRNTVKKHGYYCVIYKEFYCELDAYNEEIRVILKLRELGQRLVNVANGGEGGLSGTKLSDKHKEKLRAAKLGRPQLPDHAIKSAKAKLGVKQPRSAVDYVIGLKKKKIINSKGEIFESCSSAARHYNGLGFGMCQGIISSCARGERPVALGMSWSYEIENIPTITGRKTNKKKISNGFDVFDSAACAVSWLLGEGFKKAARQRISFSARNNGHKAYGYQWSYV